MLKVEKKVVYKAFGLSITSEIHLPELSRVDHQEVSADIEIRVENISYEFLKKQNDLIIDKKFVIFKVPDAALFCIEEGKRITVSLLDDYDEALIRLYLLGSCMGVILMQRRIFPLHGSAIAINGKAYAIIGDSGAGKSTLASAFLSKGYNLLSDDIIAVSFAADGETPIVIPSYPQQKLWQESLNEFGVESGKFHSIYGRETKFSVPVSSQYFAEPLPLAGIIELVKSEDSKIEFFQIEKLERFHTLYRHTYRNFLMSGLGLIDWHFGTSAKIINAVAVFHLRRPDSRFTAYELISTIMNGIEKGG